MVPIGQPCVEFLGCTPWPEAGGGVDRSRNESRAYPPKIARDHFSPIWGDKLSHVTSVRVSERAAQAATLSASPNSRRSTLLFPVLFAVVGCVRERLFLGEPFVLKL